MNEGHLWSSPRGAPLTDVIKVDDDSVVGSGDSHIMYLTPAQDQARRSFHRGVLVGPAGTGKTVVLTTKANQHLEDEDGSRILYIAPYPHDVRMRKHFEGELL